jgi:PleD family two-component response regulator
MLLLKSHIGEGTTAEIWLPACQDEKVPVLHAAEPSHSASRSSRPISVLVVEDDLLVLDSIAAMLDDLGHAVIEARSGEEAVQLLPRVRARPSCSAQDMPSFQTPRSLSCRAFPSRSTRRC